MEQFLSKVKAEVRAEVTGTAVPALATTPIATTITPTPVPLVPVPTPTPVPVAAPIDNTLQQLLIQQQQQIAALTEAQLITKKRTTPVSASKPIAKRVLMSPRLPPTRPRSHPLPMVRPHTKKYRTSTGDDQEEEEQDAYEMEEEYDE